MRYRNTYVYILALAIYVTPNKAVARDTSPSKGGAAYTAVAASDAPATAQPQASAKPIYGPVLTTSVDVRGAMPPLAWDGAPPTVPPRLVEAIATASRRNPSVVSAWFLVRASHADVRSAKWRRFPSVSTQLNTWSSGTNRTIGTLQVGVPVITFGRIGAGIKRAEAEQDVALANWRQRVLEVTNNATQAYFQYFFSQRREIILAEGVEEHRRLVESMARRVEQEVSPLADLELARTRLAQMRQELAIARSQRTTWLSQLREVVQDPEFEPGIAPQFASELYGTDWQDAEAKAIAYDANRERLLAQAEAARTEIEAARASLLPQLDAVYSYDDYNGSRAGLALKVQSAAGLSQLSQINGAQARFSQALSQVSDLERQLRQDVVSQVIQNEAARERATIAADASSTASRVSESYVRQFIAGRRSWLDVMNAVRESITAELSDVEAKYTVMTTNAQLLIRTGEWQPTLITEEDN